MTGDVRLVNGSKMAGRLEVCFNGVWGTVCRFGWTAQAATVVCKQLGFNNSGVTIIIFVSSIATDTFPGYKIISAVHITSRALMMNGCNSLYILS